jgi:hypothetical protein
MNAAPDLDDEQINAAIMLLLAPSRQVRRQLGRKGEREPGFMPANDAIAPAPLSSGASGINIPQLMKYTGPVGEAFLNDRRMITGIMGPVGSAKTTKCVAKMVKSALWQKAGPDGIHRAKWAVVRDTYPQLKKTVLATWHRWFPKQLGQWNGEAPYEHTLIFTIFAGVKKYVVELTVIFAAIGENKAEDVMRGWEVTGIWLNEGDLVAFEVFAYAMTRVGRYPSSSQGGCQWRGVILDMNAPDIENWTYGVFVEQDLGIPAEALQELMEELGEMFGVGFHVQPGGRDKDANGKPIAENYDNLPRGYYAQQVAALSKTPWLVRRMVDNKFGPTRNGQPVFTEYNDEIHCAKVKLDPIPGVPLKISADAGLTPAAAIRQRDPATGQIRFLGEVVVFAETENEQLEQLGARAFGQRVGRYIKTEFPEAEVYPVVRIDPAGAAGEGASGADPSWRENFQKGLQDELGPNIRVRKSQLKTNKLEARLQAVRSPMLTLLEGGIPGFIICPVRCKIIRRGFKGKYVIARTKLAGGEHRFSDSPLKNQESHVQDAVQYGCIDEQKGSNDNDEHPAGPSSARRSGRRQVKVESRYNVHSRAA